MHPFLQQIWVRNVSNLESPKIHSSYQCQDLPEVQLRLLGSQLEGLQNPELWDDDDWKISLDLSSLSLGLRSSITLSSTVDKFRNCINLESPNTNQGSVEAGSSAIEVSAIIST